MSVALPELASVRVHETPDELVVEVEVPDEVDLSRLSVQRADGVIEIRLPRTPRQHERIPGFHPDASGV
jgi:HSP20 family molecular chaperone IbpA